MTALRRAARPGLAALLAIFLAWQTFLAGADLLRATASATVADRRFALTASEAARVRAATGSWVDIHRAIEEHVPRNAVVAFLFRLEPEPFDRFYRLSSLIYPRRALPIIHPLGEEELAAAGRRAAVMDRPVFMVDVRSGFPLPPGAERVAAGGDFALWRLR